MVWNHHWLAKWKKTVGLSTRFQMHDKMFVYIFSVQSFHIMMTSACSFALVKLIILFLQMKWKHFPQSTTSNVWIVGISYTCILISKRLLIILITSDVWFLQCFIKKILREKNIDKKNLTKFITKTTVILGAFFNLSETSCARKFLPNNVNILMIAAKEMVVLILRTNNIYDIK